MSIHQKLNQLKDELPQGVTLVAISKTHPPAVIMEAYNAGQRVFGENKVQELVSKFEVMPKDIEWHLVGHLQTNKIKYIVPFVKLIHSVDSLKLLLEIDKQAAKKGRSIDCLFQMHIAEEESKFGLSIEELHEILKSDEYKSLKNIRVVGLMGMATFTNNLDQVRKEFKGLSTFFRQLKKDYFNDSATFSVLSMGMSGDYRIAIDEGSTMIRVGSNIFGERFYGTN
jgi:pyridoxal phosphate enzyme (YggS family)